MPPKQGRRPVLASAIATFLFALDASPVDPLGPGPDPLGAQDSRTTALGQLSSSFEDLAASVSPAVVQIFASGRSIRRDGGSGQGVIATQRASGSGVIVDPAGFIVTNQHVIQGANTVRISLANLTEAAYADIGKFTRRVLDELHEEFKKDKG